MSFSLSATGNRAQVLQSLYGQATYGKLGAAVLQLLAQTVEEMPDTISDGYDDRRVMYSISASGHSDPFGYSTPYLSVSLTSNLAPAPPKPAEEAAPPEQDPAADATAPAAPEHEPVTS